MRERVRYGLVSLVPRESWLRMHAPTSGARPPRVRDYILRSPRSDGRFQIDTVAMPTDMGRFDVDRLRRLVERSWRSPFSLVSSFDEVTWEESGVACIARSTVSNPDARLASRMREWSVVARMREEERAELERYLADPTVRRDWYVACGTDMANIWYRCVNGEAVAADLADCEDMVRSIRFESGHD